MEKSAFDKLLRTEEPFYRMECRQLAHLAAGLGVPRAEIEDVVAEAWLEAVEYRHQFADEDGEWQLHCWLSRVVRSKAVDALRRLSHHPCESLDRGNEELIDDVETRRVEAAEWGEWLTVHLEKVGAGKEDNLRLLCGHFLHDRSIQDLAREAGMRPCAIDGRIRRLLRKLREQME